MADRRSPPLTRADLVLVLLAVLLIVLLWLLRSVAILVAFALLLAYALDPIVSALTRIEFRGRRHLPRPVASFAVIVLLLGLIGALAAFAIPLLTAQLGEFLGRVPAQVESLIQEARRRAALSGAGASVAVETLAANARTQLPELAGLLFRWIGGAFARLDSLLGIIVLPVLTFYLLADAKRVRENVLRFLPEELRGWIITSGKSVDRSLQSYVRGQALVCLAMGSATGAMLATAGVPNALFLGVVVGVAEILPFLGALVAGVAIALSGLSVDPWRAVIGLSIYAVNNWLLSTFVTPRVMERYLKIHPFVVIVSVLAGAQLLGPPGAILALPTAALMQSVVEDMARRRRARAE